MSKRGSGYTQPPGWQATVKRIMERDQGRCYITGCDNEAVSVDHIIPVAAFLHAGQLPDHRDSNLGAICAPHKATKDEQDRLDGIARQPRARRTPEVHPSMR